MVRSRQSWCKLCIHTRYVFTVESIDLLHTVRSASLRIQHRSQVVASFPHAIRGVWDASQSLLACYSALPDRRPPWAQIHSSQFPLFPLLEAQQRRAWWVSASPQSRRAKSFWIWMDFNCARTGLRNAVAGAMTANPRIL